MTEEGRICETLIESVRKFDNLYNIKSLQYKDQQLKDNAWRKVAEEVKISADEARRRWKNLRNMYAMKVREQKLQERSGAGATKTERWPYFRWLEFLRDTIRISDTRPNRGACGI